MPTVDYDLDIDDGVYQENDFVIVDGEKIYKDSNGAMYL